MNKVSDVLGERSSQDQLETYFCKYYSPVAWIDELLLLMTLVMLRLFETKKYSSQ